MFTGNREHALFDAMRDAPAPVWTPEPDGPGFWSLVRYDQVTEAARDHARLLSGKGTQIKDRRAEGHGFPSVHNADPPLHGHLRAIVLPELSRQRVEALTPRVRAIVDELVNAAPRGEPFDFVEHVAITLPMMVIAAVLGVPSGEERQLVGWANTMSDVTAGAEAQGAAREHLFGYFRELCARKRVEPGHDVATALVNAELDGDALPQGALDAYFMLLTVAGNETTRFLLTGGLEQLLGAPDQLAKLRGERALVAPAVEEMCRWVSPVIHMRRTAAADMDLYGAHVPAGGKVVLWFAAANRDPARFADPHALRVDRAPNPHVGFGVGAHFCVGAHLARLESRLFLDAFLDRVADARVVTPAERLASNWFTGWTRLEVEWA